MATPNRAINFFDELIEDHRTYTKTWNDFWSKNESAPLALEKAWDQLRYIVNWTQLFIHDYHCAKEEQFLFPEIQKNPRLSEGGPMCSLYFDQVMQNNPIERVLKITHDDKAVNPKPQTQSYFDKKSPLIIPLQDHMASQRLIENLQSLLKEVPSEPLLKKAYDYAHLHNDIERLHFLKEETCLFVFAPNLIDAETLNNLEAASKKFKSEKKITALI